ncbi:DUF1378 family protein [Rosenbergiella epipactidis]|uniref:DUF1378 family protein n=1 Tax=Rosenbergiella epipactidis TaxID=1544694 RepID=UPI001F4E108A|nr:DUF1378 family protein [Rosenbergiella epipactidis]
MTGFQLLMLYFSTSVSVLLLISGGYKVIRDFISAKFESAVAAKAAGANKDSNNPS